MKNLGRNLLSMGLMLAMVFNCANIVECLELTDKAKKNTNGKSVCDGLLFQQQGPLGLILTTPGCRDNIGGFLPEEQKEILNLIVYAGLIERSEVRDRDSLEKDMFGRVLSENERLGKLYYLEGLKAQYGPKLLELLGVKKEVREYAAKAVSDRERGEARQRGFSRSGRIGTTSGTDGFISGEDSNERYRRAAQERAFERQAAL